MTAGRRPLVAAHRGGSLLWPENSLRAYRGAIALGVDGVETDVHLSADDHVVLIHDPTLERTTTGRGPVRAHTLAMLSRLRLREPDGAASGDAVATLDGLLELLAPTSVRLLVEIKPAADGAPYPGIEERVLAALRRHGRAAGAIVMAFEAPTLERVRELESTIATALLVRRRVGARRASDDLVARARMLGAEYIGLDHRLADGGIVAAAHAAGLGVITWVVDEPSRLRRMAAAGVDIVESDRPDIALRALR